MRGLPACFGFPSAVRAPKLSTPGGVRIVLFRAEQSGSPALAPASPAHNFKVYALLGSEVRGRRKTSAATVLSPN